MDKIFCENSYSYVVTECSEKKHRWNYVSPIVQDRENFAYKILWLHQPFSPPYSNCGLFYILDMRHAMTLLVPIRFQLTAAVLWGKSTKHHLQLIYNIFFKSLIARKLLLPCGHAMHACSSKNLFIIHDLIQKIHHVWTIQFSL